MDTSGAKRMTLDQPSMVPSSKGVREHGQLPFLGHYLGFSQVPSVPHTGQVGSAFMPSSHQPGGSECLLWRSHVMGAGTALYTIVHTNTACPYRDMFAASQQVGACLLFIFCHESTWVCQKSAACLAWAVPVCVTHQVALPGALLGKYPSPCHPSHVAVLPCAAFVM